MKVGRKKKIDPPLEWKVNVPRSLGMQVELLLLDPLTHKTRYGARSKLITNLLQDWLKEQTNER